MSEETLRFEAEVSRLLDIVANSLYSNKEIFLRELISNASDACDRLRYAALTQPDLIAGDPDLSITLSVDQDAGTVTVADNGMGMNRDELIANLGTIARSGTAAFMEQVENAGDVNLIGQFGVGFYSAFMVAEAVEVLTRKAGETGGWRWVSSGTGDFTVAESEDAPVQGTKVILSLKPDEKEFLERERLRQIVKTYSDHITIPVFLAPEAKDGTAEQLNSAAAIWTRPKSEITDEQYTEFYHHAGHAFDEPWLRLHFKAEGVLEYTGLLYVPTMRPMDLFDPERRNRVKLYVKRVFITDDCAELLPSYLRFLRGVVDTEDLPLNISRELLQHDRRLTKIRAGLVKRVLGELQAKAETSPDEYATFWETFGPVLKEGLYEDAGQRDSLLSLVRFRSTTEPGWVSLADYVGRMKEGQEAIYTISGDDADLLRRSPQLEGFAAKGIEVLLLTDPVDDFWLQSVPDYQDKPFKSVTRGAADLDKVAAPEGAADEPEEKTESAAGIDALVAYLRLALKDELKDVKVSERLTESPVCLVADESGLDMHLERLLRQHKQLDQVSQRIMELNPKHALIRGLAERVGKEGAGDEVEQAARLLLDQARILEGETLPDPSGFAKRLSEMMARGLGA